MGGSMVYFDLTRCYVYYVATQFVLVLYVFDFIPRNTLALYMPAGVCLHNNNNNLIVYMRADAFSQESPPSSCTCPQFCSTETSLAAAFCPHQKIKK